MIGYSKNSKEKIKKWRKIGFIVIFARTESKIDTIGLNLQVPDTLPVVIRNNYENSH